MSFEGYYQMLCEKGHENGGDVYSVEPENAKCSFCESEIVWWRIVDQTNGTEEDDPVTYPTGLRQIGQDDDWKVDHYGNKFAIAVPVYERPK